MRRSGSARGTDSGTDKLAPMAIARLSGGPLDGQVIPLPEETDDESMVLPYGEGQLIYRREGGPTHTGADDGPTEWRYAYVEATEPIDPDPDERDQ